MTMTENGCKVNRDSSLDQTFQPFQTVAMAYTEESTWTMVHYCLLKLWTMRCTF